MKLNVPQITPPLAEALAQTPTNGLPNDDEDATTAEWTSDRHPSVDHETTTFAPHLNHVLSDTLTLTALTGYSEFDDNGSEYARGGLAGITFGEVRDIDPNWLKGKDRDQPDSTITTLDYVFQDGNIDSFSQEFRVTQTLDNVTWIAGLNYSDSSVKYDTRQDFGISPKVNFQTGLGFSELLNKVDQDTTTYADFASADWLLGEQWTITTGIRYSDDQADYKGCTVSLDADFDKTWSVLFAPPADNGCVTILQDGAPGVLKKDLDEDSTSWRLAANYDWTDNTSVYASYSHGFIGAAVGYLDTEVDNGIGFNQLSQKIDMKGSDLPFASEPYEFDDDFKGVDYTLINARLGLMEPGGKWMA